MGKRLSPYLARQEIRRAARLSRQYGAERAILYGSFARGDYSEASDLDVLMLKRTDIPLLDRIGEVLELWHATPHRVAIEPLVYTPEEWRQVKHRDFFRTVVREGVDLL